MSSLFLSAIAAASPAPVVGGSTTKPGAWPDVVAVLADEGTCSGTLIAPDVVLTAGHCASLHVRQVVVDSVDYMAPGGETIAVARSVAYPDWESTYDVGIAILAKPAKLAKPRAIARACNGKTLAAAIHIVGFGLIDAAGTGDNTRLHEAAISVEDPRCTEDRGCNPDVAPDGEFTAGGHGTDSCFGDSGGPAFAKLASGYALIGVVSRGVSMVGKPCGQGGIYVRADKVASWIEKTSDRKLVRSACDRPADEGEIADEDSSGGGCDATGGATGGSAASLALIPLVSGFVWRRKRRAAAEH